LVRELNLDPVVAREPIGVTVDLGVVTLRGRVTRQLAKDRAVEHARVVRGVRAIVDRITMVPVGRTDRDLEFVVADVLSRDAVTAERPIAACVHDGMVRLSGEVDSIATMRIAVSDVLSIPGVRRVSNDLAVRPQHLNDEAISLAVERTLGDDPWLDPSRIMVDVHERVVRLRGSVRSAAERARADNDARTSSPAGVDVSALGIALADDGTARATPGLAPDDATIEEAVRLALAVDPRVGPFSPTVRVRHRAVVLTGVVPNTQVMSAAEDDARNGLGVAEVRNDMKEQAAVAVERDETVLAEVNAAVTLDPRLNALHIAVDVRRGRVHLRGRVPTSADRMNAIMLASSVPGAIDVDDDLLVEPTGLALASGSAAP
jgi:osmotically-inducible protein OsmY